MPNSLKKIDNFLMALISYITSALLAIAACLGLLQILSRFFFKFPFEWTEVLIRISLAWMIFLGIAVVFRIGGMITVDMMRRLMPDRYKKTHSIILLLITLVFLAILGRWGFTYASRSGRQTIIGLEFMTMYWVYMCLPIGCVFASLAAIAHYFDPPPEHTDAEIENTV